MAEAFAQLVEPGLWVDIATPSRPAPTPALFLDRDGTVMVDTGYPRRPDEVALIPEILPAIRTANRLGLPVVLVTNQSGIARGLLGWADFAAVDARLKSLLAGAGCTIEATLACAYFPSADAALDAADHPMRKPNPGMLHLASERLDLDLQRSLIVGDKPTDLEAGASAGLSHGFLVGADPIEVLPNAMPWTRLAHPADWDRLTEAITACARPR